MQSKTLKKKINHTYLLITTALFIVLLISPTIATAGFGIGFSPVLSESMRPSFSAGDLQITKLEPVKELVVGDIILVRDEESFATFSHRIALKEFNAGNYLITLKGDSNPTKDRAKVIIPTGINVPKVIGKVPEIGTYVNSLSGSTAKKTLIGSMFVLIGLNSFRFANRVRINKKEK